MNSPQQATAEKAGWELGARRSVEVRVRMKIFNHTTGQAGGEAFDSMAEHYIETAAGQRYYEMVGLKDGIRATRSAHYADGKRCADVEYQPEDVDKQLVVAINRQFWMEDRSDRRQAPQPLLYLHVGRERLDAALARAEHLGRDQVLGRDCEVFLFPNVRWAVPQDQVYSLDAATSIPLKVESFRDAASRKAQQHAGVWTALSVETIQGHLVPMTSRLVGYGPDKSPTFTWDWQVESIEFDKDYPASTFWPTIQPGVEVMDSIARTAATTPGGEPKVATVQAPATLVPATPAAPPATAVDVASYVSIGLGACLLLAGLLMWRARAAV